MNALFDRAHDTTADKLHLILGLARMGAAASDSQLGIDLSNGGYRETFEAIAQAAQDGYFQQNIVTASDPLLGPDSPITQAGQDTPILRLFRRHQALSAASTAHAVTHPSANDDEIGRLFTDEMTRLDDEMMALPCQTPADFAAKSIVSSCNGTLTFDWDTDPLWQEARTLIAAASQ